MASSPPRTSRSGPLSRRALSVLAVGALGAGLVVALPSAAGAATGRVSYPGSVPNFAKAHAGTPVTKRVIEGEVYLRLKDLTGAQLLATAVSTPNDARYHQYLDAQQWIDNFAPTTSSFQQVKRYVQSQGATIVGTPASRLYVVFTMPADSTTSAFGTSLHNYRFQGKTVSAPSSAPTLPASIAKYVTGITLGNARALTTHPDNVRVGAGTPDGAQAASGATPNAVGGLNPSCSQYYGQVTRDVPTAYGNTSYPTNICGYEPDQLRSAGDVNKQIYNGADGSGQTIAIVDAYDSPSIVSDTNRYMAAVHSPILTSYTDISPSPSKFILKGVCQQPSGWQAEQAIDVQSAHSIAPGARILYSGGFDCAGGLDLALSRILDQNRANIVSNSYGNQGEAVGSDAIAGEENIHIEAAGIGVGLYFSSGDSGDESVNLGYPQPDYPATSPWVTAVGGTDEAIGADGSYEFETGWGSILDQIVGGYPGRYSAPLPGNLYGGGAGGGISSVFAEPDYQKGVVPDSVATQNGTAARVVPDIADLADPYTGFEISISPIINDRTLETGDYTYETYGGTSLASPIAAAKMALVQDATGKQLGFANPVLYAASTNAPDAFHDVDAPPAGGQALYYHSARSGHHFLITLNEGFSISTGPGYDTITGVGSLKVPQLNAYLDQF